MADDLAGVEFLLAEDDPQQRALAGAVAADEPDLAVVGDRGRGPVEQHLVAVPLAGVLDVEQNGHQADFGAGVSRAGAGRGATASVGGSRRAAKVARPPATFVTILHRRAGQDSSPRIHG